MTQARIPIEPDCQSRLSRGGVELTRPLTKLRELTEMPLITSKRRNHCDDNPMQVPLDQWKSDICSRPNPRVPAEEYKSIMAYTSGTAQVNRPSGAEKFLL